MHLGCYDFSIFVDMLCHVDMPVWQRAWELSLGTGNDLFTHATSLPLLSDVWAPYVSFIFNLWASLRSEGRAGACAVMRTPGRVDLTGRVRQPYHGPLSQEAAASSMRRY
jgi:hypothetical protein